MNENETKISYARLVELATLFKDGLIQDGEAEAMEYFIEACKMTPEEMEFFGIGMETETD